MNDIISGSSVSDPYAQVSSVYKAIKALADNVPQAPLRFTGEAMTRLMIKAPKPKKSKSCLKTPIL
jgi:hypothetical protein